ncbi:MAG: hypothetical protein DRG24_02645 [Epsilonproteobacteria bacterium]|nr:MAG: hypothetical protein DRG24_02645 [Campylobacterota bacterium]
MLGLWIDNLFLAIIDGLEAFKFDWFGFSVVIIIIIIITLAVIYLSKYHTYGFRDRRKGLRRDKAIVDRRRISGRRHKHEFEHESQLSDRRRRKDRRYGSKTRRRRNQRKEDRVSND